LIFKAFYVVQHEKLFLNLKFVLSYGNSGIDGILLQ